MWVTMKPISSSTLRPRRKPTKMMPDVPGPKYQRTEGDMQWGPVSSNTLLHSGGRGSPLLQEQRALACTPSELVCGVAAGDSTGLAGREAVPMLHRTGEHVLRPCDDTFPHRKPSRRKSHLLFCMDVGALLPGTCGSRPAGGGTLSGENVCMRRVMATTSEDGEDWDTRCSVNTQPRASRQ